jgi:hypothetical protein
MESLMQKGDVIAMGSTHPVFSLTVLLISTRFYSFHNPYSYGLCSVSLVAIMRC